MAASNPSPSPLLLQRKLSRGDSRKWRTLLRLRPEQMQMAERMIALARQIDPLIAWRVATTSGDILGGDEG